MVDFNKFLIQSMLPAFIKSNQSVFPVLKKVFDAFDREKQGFISTDMMGTILEMLGINISDAEIEEIVVEVDADCKYSSIFRSRKSRK
jgi:Ca2+-binding EF-hand superfamily protein